MIDVLDVALSVGSRSLLSHVNASIAAGEFIAMLGPNGVGKTTLLRAIAGLHPCAHGEITIDGKNVALLTATDRARHIAFVTSDDTLTDALTVRDVVSTGRYPHHRWWQWTSTPDDDAAVDDALDEVQMRGYGARLFTTLSSGERQRAWIAMGLAQDAPVLLLDEPTSHLDIRAAHEILGLLKTLTDKGKTVVCVLHDLNDAAAYADRLMLLARERVLAFGGHAEVLRPALVEAAFGVAMEAMRTPSGVRIFPRARQK